ncbi:MAG: hypothetical protein IJ072_06305, partial [Oscillospiraceae bacterium]|nr:hypothetical protein [Oscillospiraceae bacterium]
KEGENNDRWNKLDSIASERTIREIYLKGFEIVCKTADPYGIMTAYQMINGKYAAASDELVGILRDEWGFTGLSMTDWSGDWGNVIADLSSRATDICMPANNGMLTYLYTSLLIAQNENRGLTYQEAGGKFDVGKMITTDILKEAAASQLNTLMNMRAFYNYYSDELAELGYNSYEEMPTSYKVPEKQFETSAEKVNLVAAGTATVGYGEEASVDVTITNHEGFSSVRVQIDSEIPFESITGDFRMEYNPANGKVVVYVSDGELETEDTVLFTINYKIDEVYSDGEYPINVTVLDSTGADDELLAASTQNGTLIIANAYPKGDINRDMQVNNVDLIMIARYLVDLEQFDDQQMELADFNDDGKVNNVDLVLIARAIVAA